MAAVAGQFSDAESESGDCVVTASQPVPQQSQTNESKSDTNEDEQYLEDSYSDEEDFSDYEDYRVRAHALPLPWLDTRGRVMVVVS